MITGRLPTDDPLIQMGRCSQAEIASEAALTAHTDGELFCLPQDNLRRLSVQIMPGALAVRVPAAAGY
jgi:diacylglycerol kinase family enzyme